MPKTYKARSVIVPNYPAKLLPLSPREEKVMLWTACGKSCEEIAGFLEKSEETIRTQLKSACKKLNASNKTHAVAIALTHGVLLYGASPERVITLPLLFGLSKRAAEQRTEVTSQITPHSTAAKRHD